MKIDKIQCDICGKMVDYNDKKIGNMLSNRSFANDQPCIDRGFYDRFKVNRLTIYGVTKIKNVQEFVDKDNDYEDVIIDMELDLCEDCLIELCKTIKIINKYMKEDENEFSS